MLGNRNNKKSKKDEPVKLDMSFEDAIRLAMKTPPIMSIQLKLDERVPVDEVAGRKLIFESIVLDNLAEHVSQFTVLIEQIFTNKEGKEIVTPNIFHAYMDPKQPDKGVGYFPKNLDGTLNIADNVEVFATLHKFPSYESKVKTAALTVGKATKF